MKVNFIPDEVARKEQIEVPTISAALASKVVTRQRYAREEIPSPKPEVRSGGHLRRSPAAERVDFSQGQRSQWRRQTPEPEHRTHMGEAQVNRVVAAAAPLATAAQIPLHPPLAAKWV